MDNLQNISPKIREVLDGKGTPMPDIGAIIAISLLSDEYLTIINSSPQKDFIEVPISDQKMQCNVKIYFANDFSIFRSNFLSSSEKDYVNSLSTSSPWYPQGGKSGEI
uniref:Uncharacterized protein n=1 Tax=Meloidogyne javanica TaxID=6303 RepID=A0A915MFG5_MELJA